MRGARSASWFLWSREQSVAPPRPWRDRKVFRNSAGQRRSWGVLLARIVRRVYARTVSGPGKRRAPGAIVLAVGLFLLGVWSCSGTEAALVVLPAGAPLGGAGGGSNPGPEPQKSPLFGLSSFRIQLSEQLDLSSQASLYVLDANSPTDADLAALRAQGSLVACYFSAGSFEPWRPDAAEFSESVLGNSLSNYPDERWLDITSEEVMLLMEGRIDAAAQRGCDAVYPSVVRPTGGEDSGFDLSLDSFHRYEERLADLARERGLTSLYAGGSTYDAGASPYDGALVFGCVAGESCESWAEYAQGKGVYSVEFGAEDAPEASCGPTPGDWPVLVKAEDLGAFSFPCP